MKSRTYGDRKPRAVRYPRQIVVMVPEAVGARLDALADEGDRSLGAVVRDLLEASLKASA